LDTRTGHQLDAELLVGLRQLVADLRVLQRRDAVHHLHDGDIRAIAVVDVAELQANRPRADNHDLLRHLVGEDGRQVRDDAPALAVKLHAGDAARVRAGGNDQVLERERLLPTVVQVHPDRLPILDGAPALVGVDLVLLHEELDALDQPAADLTAALVRDAVIKLEVVEREAVLLALVLEQVGDLRVAQQRLRRDAADVQADAAPPLLLDDGDAQPELGGPDRGDVPTGAGAEDDDIIFLSHVSSFVRGFETNKPAQRTHEAWRL